MVPVDRKVIEYLREVSLREPDVLRRLREANRAHPQGDWATAPEQTQFLALLARIIGARCIVEVGTFTGYTTLALALAVPADGKVITLDMEPDYPNVGRPFWQEAGVADRIELRLGHAIGSLDALIEEHGPGSFDMAYIDCNKKDYDAYYERALVLLRPGGIVGLDNVLWGGSTADPNARDKATVALRAINEKLHGDSRVDISMLPVGDGLTIGRKRE